MLIQSSRASATIQPVAGGRLASLIVDDMEILVTEGEKITRWGSFPMVPWAGRLGFGRLYFDDAMHTFPITSGAHANHGVALRQEWDVVSEAESTVTIRTSLADPWPFGGSVEQVFTVSDGALRIEMTITAGEVPMPAQFGWHPWYRRELDRGEPLSIEFAAEKMYEVDDEQLVTGTLVTPPAGPWDDTFVEVTQQPVLTWGDAFTLSLSSNLDHWVVFNQMDHAVAIEPQTGAPNDLNRAPQVLQPGETLSGHMLLSWG